MGIKVYPILCLVLVFWVLDKYQIKEEINKVFDDRKLRSLKYENISGEEKYDYLCVSSDSKLSTGENVNLELIILSSVHTKVLLLNTKNRLVESNINSNDLYLRHVFHYCFNYYTFGFPNFIIRKSLNRLKKDELDKWEKKRKEYIYSRAERKKDRFTVHIIV